MTNIDELAAELEASRVHVIAMLTRCSVFVDQRAAQGDPEAQQLAGEVQAAFDRMITANLYGATAIHERNPDG